MIRRPPRSTQGVSSAASDVYKRQDRSRPPGSQARKPRMHPAQRRAAQTQGSCPSSNPKELLKLKPKGAAQAHTRRTSPGQSRAAQTQGSCPSSTQGSYPNSKPKKKLPKLKPKEAAQPETQKEVPCPRSLHYQENFPYNILSLQHPNEVSKTCLTLRPGCDTRQSTLYSPELIIYI